MECLYALASLSPDDLAREDYRCAANVYAMLEVAESMRGLPHGPATGVDDVTAAHTPEDRAPRAPETSEVGSLPDIQEGRAEGRGSSAARIEGSADTPKGAGLSYPGRGARGNEAEEPGGCQPGSNPRSTAASILDPKVLQERLWEIEAVPVSDGDVASAFERVKHLVFALRMDIFKEASGLG